MATGMKMLTIIVFAIGLMRSASAMTSAELRALLDKGQKLMIVDVRAPSLYSGGHIPGAINIPARVVARKQLPAMGRTVVYDGGLTENAAAVAADALNATPGIKAEVLAGGYALWQMHDGTTTQGAGLHEERVDYIAYAELKATKAEDVVLVDLRKPPEGHGNRNRNAQPKTDLGQAFPGMAVVKSPFDVAGTRSRKRGEPGFPPLIVLIDDVDGSARKMARILRANGVRGVLILAGGEKILERDGEPGSLRLGPGNAVLDEEE